MKKDFPIIVLGWLEADIIKRCLDSVDELEGVNPHIYFVENYSKNSDKIKSLILSVPNIKGFIRIKENQGANAWKIVMEYFLQCIDEEFVTITDGDYIWDRHAMERQYEAFSTYPDIGVMSQRRKTTCPQLSGTAFKVPIHIEVNLGADGIWRTLDGKQYLEPAFEGADDERSVHPITEKGMTRCVINGMNLTTARKKDWEIFIDVVNKRNITSSPIWLDGNGEPNPYSGMVQDGVPSRLPHRPFVFCDIDFYTFMEEVLSKASFIVNDHPSHHITDEYENDPESEYSKEKKSCGYDQGFRDYFADPNSFHDKRYPNGELKYEVIV